MILCTFFPKHIPFTLRQFSIVLILFSGGVLQAAQLSGTVQDEDKRPLPGAAVAIYSQDSLVQGTTTNMEGKYSFQLPAGNYRLEVSFIAYKKVRRQLRLSANENLSLDAIAMQPAATNLEEVTVEAQADMMQFKQDKRVFNVSKDLTNSGSNASNILNNLPSITVDVEGGVSLRGSQNVRILINGRPSGLIGDDPATALRNIPAELIEKIEVITNPSARYDAEGGAGIINIVLKKQDKAGINGSFNAEIGEPDLYGAGAALNYRKNKLNFFTNLNFRYNRAPGEAFSNQQFTLADTSFSFLRDRDQSRGGYSATLRGGADYNFNERDVLTGSFLYSPSRDNNIVDIRYRDFAANGELIQIVNRNDNEIETEETLEGTLNWQRKFKDFDDHKWTANFSYTNEDEREQSDITQDTVGSTNVLEQRVDNQENQRRVLLQTDYVHPFSESTSYEVGGRATLRQINNDYALDNVDENGDLIPVPEFNNEFQFTENVYAAYAIFNGAWDSAFTYQIGLRTEYTAIGTQLKAEEANNRDFLNLFPSAFLTYKFNPLNDVQLSYSRRINRPGFWTLAPFFGFSDNRNFFSGNPDVNPEFTDSYEAGWVRYFQGGSLYSGIYYRYRTGVIERIRTVDEEGFTRIFPINLATENNYGFEFNLQYKFSEKWRTNGNVNLFRSLKDGAYEGQDFSARAFSASGRISSTYSFWNSDFQASFNFRAPRNTTQGRRKGIYTADLAWSKELLQKRATLTLAVRDLFNSRVRRSLTFGENFTSEGRFQWRKRQVTLSFSYRLKKG